MIRYLSLPPFLSSFETISPTGAHAVAGLICSKNIALALLGRLQYLERTHQRVVYAHDGRGIVKLATVVWRRKYCHELPFCEKFIPILHHLVRAANQLEVVLLEKLGNLVGPERPRHPAVVLPPSHHVLIRIRPEQVA